MSNLTATEASILAWLAKYPDSEQVETMIGRLSGDAKSIAEAMFERGNHPPEIVAVAKAIREWGEVPKRATGT